MVLTHSYTSMSMELYNSMAPYTHFCVIHPPIQLYTHIYRTTPPTSTAVTFFSWRSTPPHHRTPCWSRLLFRRWPAGGVGGRRWAFCDPCSQPGRAWDDRWRMRQPCVSSPWRDSGTASGDPGSLLPLADSFVTQQYTIIHPWYVST